MIAIYDFEKTVADEKDRYFIEAGGKRIPLNIDKAHLFFSAAIEKYSTFKNYQEALENDEAVYDELVEALSGMTTVPENPYPDVTDKEFVLLFLRFLFNINQRYTKRFLCDAYIIGDSPEHHHHDHDDLGKHKPGGHGHGHGGGCCH